ncbi:MAG: hypothetical protein ACREFN_11640, partial [Acetobacteraceae bacterium]
MPVEVEIALAPERLDEGPPEERACFGLFTIRAGAADLTGGLDFFISAYRSGPLISGYHAAEWLAWNWWRLRYEPRSMAAEWWRAHRMTAIGEGYVWPNLTIFSDGIRTTLLAEPSARPDAKPFRYLGAHPCVVPSSEFESAVDAFLPRVLARLHDQGVAETNLDRIWSDILSERLAPDQSRRRRLEALLGRDPDAIVDGAVDGLLTDAAFLGAQAVEELAADRGGGSKMLTAADLQSLAASRSGIDASPRDAVRLSSDEPRAPGAEAPAWRLGAQAAQALRAQLDLREEPITDAILAELVGTRKAALAQRASSQTLSFALDGDHNLSRIVLRSRWPTGRRFELARLMAERIVTPLRDERLYAATRAYTYRQKMQRSFAAEMLSPFAAVDVMLDG